mgnify:CR=1 FL=1
MGLRMAEVRDLLRVVEIEDASYSFPWSFSLFARELENPFSLFFVWEEEGEVVGYACYWLVEDEAYLANIAIDPSWRKRGLGRRLLEDSLKRVRKMGAGEVVLEVRRGNRVALSLYRSVGFKVVGRRPRHYEDGEDAWVMRLKFQEVEDDGAGDYREAYGNSRGV